MEFDDIINEKDSSSEEPMEEKKYRNRKKRGRKPKTDDPLLEKQSELTKLFEENRLNCKNYKS